MDVNFFVRKMMSKYYAKGFFVFVITGFFLMISQRSISLNNLLDSVFALTLFAALISSISLILAHSIARNIKACEHLLANHSKLFPPDPLRKYFL